MGRVVQKKKKSDRIVAHRTREEMQTGRGCSQNDNEQYHANSFLWGYFIHSVVCKNERLHGVV
jgi:hypothetical protein